MVLAVNMDSPNKNQVKIGNIIKPVEEPINLAAQTDPVASTIMRHAYQNVIEVGTPIRNAAMIGLSFHQSEVYWELS